MIAHFQGCLAVVILCLAASTCAAQTARAWASARLLMVEREVATAGVKHPAILAAMREVPRHEFVPPEMRPYAYYDMALPIGEQQTISPPFIVAWMTEQLDPQPTDRVLEIGTGSGYHSAVLSRLVAQVYTIEINGPLARRARHTMDHVGYRNVAMKHGDGYAGWEEHAPFDKILVTCSPERVPPALVAQLREGGRMVIPLGERYQQTLFALVKQEGKLVVKTREPTFFVPMTGRAERLRSSKPGEPLTPLVNGDFEQLLAPGKPAGWYYVRQAVVEPGGPDDGSGHCITFSNRVAGRGSQALQAIGVDGRQIRELVVRLSVKADDVEADRSQQPGDAMLAISFFDENRAPAGMEAAVSWQGTFDWRSQTSRVEVPRDARIAIVAVGLSGATGRLSCDEIAISAPDPRTARRH